LTICFARGLREASSARIASADCSETASSASATIQPGWFSWKYMLSAMTTISAAVMAGMAMRLSSSWNGRK